MVEEEAVAVLGRGRYERGTKAGYRHGIRPRRLLGSFGPVELTLPRVRLTRPNGGSEEWHSAVVPRYACMTRQVEALIASAYLSGTNTRRVKRALGAHWTHCAKLARRFPTIRVEPDPIFVCDGKVWSSAGVTAGIDLALALVEADLGWEVTLAVARHLVVFSKRPGGQAQFSAVLALQGAEDRFGQLHGAVRLPRWGGFGKLSP